MPKVTKKDAGGPLQEAPLAMEMDHAELPSKPNFAALSAQDQNGNKVEFRRVCGHRMSVECCTALLLVVVPACRLSAMVWNRHRQRHLVLAEYACCNPDSQVAVPQHRMTPLKTNWMSLYTPITEHLKLDMRMNLQTKKVGSMY